MSSLIPKAMTADITKCEKQGMHLAFQLFSEGVEDL